MSFMVSWATLLGSIEIPRLGLVKTGLRLHHDLRDTQKFSFSFPYTQNYTSSELCFSYRLFIMSYSYVMSM